MDYIFRLVCLTMLVNAKMIEMANQIKEGSPYCSQKMSANSNVTLSSKTFNF